MPWVNEMETEMKYDKQKMEYIVKLRKLLKENENLKNLQNDDAYLERFLYGSDFDVEAAYERMKTFYELLLEYPEWFSKPAPLAQKSLIDKNIRIVIPEYDKEGRPIYIIKVGNTDVDRMQLLDVVAVDDIWIESILVRHPELTGKGLSVIIDVADYPWKMLKWFTPENIRISVKKIQSLPFKDYRIHFVNKSFLIHTTLKIVWPFLPARLREMMRFHFDDWDSLHQHIDPSALPPEYKGTNNVNYNEIYNKLYARNEEILASFRLNRNIID